MFVSCSLLWCGKFRRRRCEGGVNNNFHLMKGGVTHIFLMLEGGVKHFFRMICKTSQLSLKVYIASSLNKWNLHPLNATVHIHQIRAFLFSPKCALLNWILMSFITFKVTGCCFVFPSLPISSSRLAWPLRITLTLSSLRIGRSSPSIKCRVWMAEIVFETVLDFTFLWTSM